MPISETTSGALLLQGVVLHDDILQLHTQNSYISYYIIFHTLVLSQALKLLIMQHYTDNQVPQ